MNTTTLSVIKLGSRKPALKGIYVSPYASDLLEKVTYQKNKEDIELVIKTPRELGCIQQYPTTKQIFDAAKEQGLELCPAEVGPRLREAYEGTEWIIVAMEPITDRDGDPDVFSLYEGGGELRLGASRAHAGSEWNSGLRFVFRRRKTLKNSDASMALSDFDSLKLRIEALEAWQKRVMGIGE